MKAKNRPLFPVGSVVAFDDIYRIMPRVQFRGMPYLDDQKIQFLMSKHESLYDDKWHGDVLHYTGSGRKGDQALTQENKILAESNINGYTVHLFEKVDENYKYRGIVKLADKPYQEVKPDITGADRKVWVFPVKPMSNYSASREDLEKIEAQQAKMVRKLSLDELEQKIAKQETTPGAYRKVIAKQYERDVKLARFTKLSARGICELCEKPAPFLDKCGEPYLEAHHIIWLERGGPDTPDNTAALCPNCHKKMHILEDQADVEKLLTIARKRAEEIQVAGGAARGPQKSAHTTL